MDSTLIALDNKMKALAMRRQKGSSFLKLTSWALYHRSEFKDLLKQTISLVDNIEKLFPHSKLKSPLSDKKQQKSVINSLLSSSRIQPKEWTVCFKTLHGNCALVIST